MYAPPYLQKYKGKTTRHTCPECGAKESFTLYLDGNTHQPINKKVGICNRSSKCGYHYPPKQYFMDNPNLNETTIQNCDLHNPKPIVAKQQTVLPIGTIPFSYVERSVSYKSNFVRFLCNILTDEQITSVGNKYALGATKTNEVIFWQIDINGKVRTGKIMQYNPLTGKRIKHESGAIDWIHNKLKKSGTLPEDYNLQQCFFGEHLLSIYPDATVCIVESEKSALISSALLPDEIWLASGGLSNLSIEKCKVLKNRNIILYPDLNGYDKWLEKAIQIEKQCDCNISVSTLLEDISTPEAKAKGLDIADYMINQLTNKPIIQIPESKPIETKTIQSPPVQSRFTPELETMIETNPLLLTLINKLDLIEY